MSRFSSEVDALCQRGMLIRYTMDAVPAVFTDTVQHHFDDALRHRTETWGAVTTHRLLLPFRFELEFGHRPGCVALLLRFSSTHEERLLDKTTIETALEQSLRQEAA